MAIGDSNSEGLGDNGFDLKSPVPASHCGWTDRLATLLAHSARDNGHDFFYANLALRGSKLRTIMTTQLRDALQLKPDLVTVMAGSNDLMTPRRKLPRLEADFRAGLNLLRAAGCKVVIVNTINPAHIGILSKLERRSKRVSAVIDKIATEYRLPLVNLHDASDFKESRHWAADKVHFSESGHIMLANLAAGVIGLRYRIAEGGTSGSTRTSQWFATIQWIWLYVLPFLGRKIRGTNSGVGRRAKHDQLVRFEPGPHRVAVLA